MPTRLALLLFTAVPFAAIAADSYTLDPVHTYPYFSVEHFGLSMLYGRFNKSAGKFTIDRAAKTGSVELVIDTATVDTGDSEKGSRPRTRDDLLRSADFFDAAEFPKMTYRATNVVFSGNTPSMIDGSLTLLGVTRPVKLTVERFKCNPPSGRSKERCGGNASGKLKRSDFGMNREISAIGDEITLMVIFEGTKD